jgi:glycine cleavage system H protein
MSNVPEDLIYSKSHEWVKRDNGVVTVGITDFAQGQLGDLVYLDLPEIGQHYDLGNEVAVAESVKTAADVYSPVSGKVVAINDDLADDPGQVNRDPYGEGWLFRVELDGNADLSHLVDAQSYQAEFA